MSKSKEELASEAFIAARGHSVFASKVRCVEEAMEEWAKVQVLEFNKWREQRAELAIRSNIKLVLPKTLSELYDLFIQHQSQQS